MYSGRRSCQATGLHLVGEYRPVDFVSVDFNRGMIPSEYGSNWTDYRKTDDAVIRVRRKNKSGTTPALFMSLRFIKRKPDDISSVEYVSFYHISLPTGLPQSTFSGRLLGSIWAINSSSVGSCSFFGAITTPCRSCLITTGVPALNKAARATCFGSRTAKLFPHFCTLVVMLKSISRCIYIGQCRQSRDISSPLTAPSQIRRL